MRLANSAFSIHLPASLSCGDENRECFRGKAKITVIGHMRGFLALYNFTRVRVIWNHEQHVRLFHYRALQLCQFATFQTHSSAQIKNPRNQPKTPFFLADFK